MIVLVICLAIAIGITWGAYEISLLVEYGSAPKDSDVLEMLEKFGSDYNNINRNWDDCYYIRSATSYVVKDIWKSKIGILFPYYIPSVGVIPAWYKSAGIIETMFKELKESSQLKNEKRKKLGLD
jgi:hypothetical protein